VAEALWLSVAMEVMLLPVWMGAAVIRSGARSLARRMAVALGPIVAPAAALAALAAAGDGPTPGAVLRSQAVVLGFAVLLAGTAAILERLAGPRCAQFLTAVFGWALVAAVVLFGPLVEVLDEPVKTTVVRVVAHTNPLLVAEAELGLRWLHQGLTYRWTPLGESYSYLFGDLAWWKTVLAHVFAGSGLAVFSLRREGRGHAPGEPGG